MLAVSPPPSHRTQLPAWRGSIATPAGPNPRQNQLLAALPAEDYERLLPLLRPIALRAGSTVHLTGEREQQLLFLTAGIVSRQQVMQDGSSAEYAITGNEGVIGIASFLGGGSTLSRAVALSPGHAYWLGAGALRDEITRGGALQRLLLLYTHALLTEAAQSAACNRYHSIEQQLCRWILSCLDRVESNQLDVTHELIANLLGVRREGVTEAAGRLQKAGFIRYCRGHMTVLDRCKLEARACECHAAIKQEYERLLPEMA